MKRLAKRFWKLSAIGIFAVAAFLLLGAGEGTPPASTSDAAGGSTSESSPTGVIISPETNNWKLITNNSFFPWEDLRDILRDTQLALLPGDEPVTYDLGALLLLPGGTWLQTDDSAINHLSFIINHYFVTVFEDPNTRNTVFLDCDDNLLYELPPEEDYSPAWVFLYDRQYLEGGAEHRPPDTAYPPEYDPSLITLTATLFDPFGVIAHKGSTDSVACDQSISAGGIPSATDNWELTTDVSSSDGSTDHSSLTTDHSSLITNHLPLITIPDGTVYVDSKNGDDSLSGRRATRTASTAVTAEGNPLATNNWELITNNSFCDGPKRTLSAGKAALDQLVTSHSPLVTVPALIIREGDYPESLDLRGRDVRIKIEGSARIGKAVMTKYSEKNRPGMTDNLHPVNEPPP